MAFFKTFQQNLPSVSSLVNTISSAVEDLSTAVGEVGCALTDSVAEQVASMMHGFCPDEEHCAAEEAADPSKAKNAMLWDVSKNSACPKTQSDLEHRAKQINCYSTSVTQKQEQGTHEQRFSIRDRQQAPSEFQETGNAGGSASKGPVSNGISALRQNMMAASVCHELGGTNECAITGIGLSRNDTNDLKEVSYQETKGNKASAQNVLHKQKHMASGSSETEEQSRPQHVPVGSHQEKLGICNKKKHLPDLEHSDHSFIKAEKHSKHDGFQGKECSGKECSPEDTVTNSRHRTQMIILKEDTYPAPATHFKDKFP